MIAERAYRLMLLAYPPRFRGSYGHEMVLLFRDQRRNGSATGVPYWISLVADVARSAPRLWGEQFNEVLHNGESIMKPMAVVAMMVGAFEVFNTLAEVQGGGFTNRDAMSQAGLLLAISFAVLLLAAGGDLVRRGRRAMSLAAAAGLGCLCAFAFVGLARPVLSVFSMLLGIGFPIVLLVFLFLNRGDGMAKA
jgi:hypothetical protein